MALPTPQLSFVIVGAQKAGSTNLAASLAQHPAIFMPPDEVPYFESPFFERSDPNELSRALAPAAPGQLRGIRRPDYLARPECPENIRSVAPEAKAIACLRDPVERAVSAYYWYMKASMLPLRPPEEGLAALLDGAELTGYPRAGDILDYGFYDRHLTRYMRCLTPARVHVVLYQDLRTDEEALRSVHRFLGVAERPHDGDRSKNPGVYDMRRLRWLRAGARFRFSWNDEDRYTWRRRRWRRPVGFVPHAAIVGVDRVVLRRVLGNGKASLSPELEERLRRFYAPDVEALQRTLDRDLTSWLPSS